MNAAYALNELGIALGLGPLEQPVQGALNIVWNTDARLSIETSEAFVLIYAIIPTPHLDHSQQLALLQACDVRRNTPSERPIQLGMQGHGADAQLLMLMRWPSQSVQASQLLSSIMTFERNRLEWLGQQA